MCDKTIDLSRRNKYKHDLIKFVPDQNNILVDKAKELFSILKPEYYKSYVHEPSKIWGVLDKISLPHQFELCSKVNHFSHYKRRISQLSSLYISDNETKDMYEMKDVIFVNPDIMGAWQAYLLINSNDILNQRYPRHYIFTLNDINSINRLNKLDFTDLHSSDLIEPVVEIREQGDITVALVSCLYWVNERLYREVVRMKIMNKRIVSYKQLEKLEIYDSRIRTYY
jgi:hypothetical protein